MASKKAIKTLAAMRNSAAGWKQEDIERVYLGFGFDVWSGKNHDIARHPKYREIQGMWPRHGSIAKAYIRELIRNIDLLSEIEKARSD
jgi:hypothetical protein